MMETEQSEEKSSCSPPNAMTVINNVNFGHKLQEDENCIVRKVEERVKMEEDGGRAF